MYLKSVINFDLGATTVSVFDKNCWAFKGLSKIDCSRHYNIPLYPDIHGSESFPGSAIHSHSYKVPEVYQGKDVLIIGIGPSATDIAYDISPYAKLVRPIFNFNNDVTTTFISV